jgi:hypothetical protein
MFMVEIVVVLLIIVVVAVIVEVTPYLASSRQNDQIGVFNQKIYAQKTVTLAAGQSTSSQFNFTTYDPAILVVDLDFKDCKIPGNLSVYCNGIIIASFEANPRKPHVQLTTVTFSGYDLVKPPPPQLAISSYFAYGNEISFLSPQQNGYSGTFSYTIGIRGSR